MLHQLSFKLLSGLFGITRDKSKALMILLASILLTACGGSESTKEALLEPGPDGDNPTISNLLAVNQCNYTKSVGPGNTIIFDITGSESLMKPTVTILGEAVEITGQHRSWQGKYTVTGPMENNYPTISELQIEIKEFISTFSDTAPAVEEIFDFTAFSELGGSALASALSTEYGIAITAENQLDPAFAYGTLFDNIIEAQLPSVKIFKETVAQFNEPILDSNGNEIEVPLQFLNLGLPTDNGEPNEVIKEIMSVFGVKTTQGELDNIAQAEVPQYAWIDKIQSLEIPVTITYADNSGMQGEDITLTSIDALRYCEDGVCQCFPEDISGKWQLRPKAGSMGVGRAEGDIGDWFATDFIWGTERACLWDDEYIFKAVNANNPQSGSFVQIMGDSTWLEPWQSPNGVEECGTPQSPFDGSTDDMTYQWNIEEGTLTLFGFGAHIGLPRVANDEENTGAIPFDRPVVYTIQTASDDLISLNIKTASASPWWHFELAKVGSVDVDDSDSDLPVDDTPLELDSISIDSNANTITLALGGSAGTSAPLAADFQITQAGQPLVVDSVSINGSTFVLNINDLDEGSVQVSYTPSDDNQALLGFTQMVISDGYIRNAEVYADNNNNGIADNSELLDGVTSDALGQLVISGDYGDTQIIIKGGVNVDTGAINKIELTAPAGYLVINPLSTMVQEIIVSDETQTVDQAEVILSVALGITLGEGEDLSNYDPVSDVSENAIVNRVATTQIATVLAVAAAADEADTSGDLDIEATVLGNLVELMTTASNVVTLDNSTVESILSDDSGDSLVSTEDLTAITTAVDAMEAIKQSSGSVDIATALNQMIQAQAVAIDNVSPASPVLAVDAGQLKVSFNTTLENGSAIVAGDKVELFDGDISVSIYELQKADIDQGFYTLQLSSAPDINTQYTATVLDIAGNISNQSAPVVYETVAPLITSAASGSVVEGSGADQIIYTAEANEDVNFSLVGSYAALSINTTGAVTLNVDPDFEVKSEYSFTVIATDALGNSSAALPVTVVVTNIDEVAPSITSATVTAINENSGAGQSLYTATATDDSDISQGVTFSLAGETLGFSIDASSGSVTTNADFAADYEAATSQSFTVVATDGAGNASQQTVSVAVNNVDEAAPVFESPTTASVLESEPAGVAVYQVLVDDSSDISNGVTYSLSGVDASSFDIDQAGVVSIIDNPEASVKTSYSFTVIADDGINQSQQAVTLTVIDQDLEAPVFTSSATPTINENIGENQVVYTAEATDDFLVTYSLEDGYDSGLSIDASTGKVSLDVNPDSYTKNVYSFTVVATDSSGNASQLAVTLAVNSIDDVAPTITSAATATSIDESSGAGQVIYTATSDDAEASYSLGADSDSALAINAATGDVTLTTNPVYVTQSEYIFAVIATDAVGNISEPQSVTLTINEVTAVDTGNLVTDGTFDAATSTTWYGNAYNPVEGLNQANVETAGNPWDVNLSGYVNVTAGSDYTLSFDASGTDGRTMVAGIGQSVDPFMGHTSTVTLSATSQTMVMHLTAALDGTGDGFGGDTTRVIFDMGADTGAVNIDNVSLTAGHTGTVNLGAGNDTGGDTGGDTPPAYGRQGPLDMTGAYGNGAVSGDEGEFFKNDPLFGFDYSGFASLTTELYPFEFGTGGTLEFTASVPTGESVDVSFQLQKQGSDAGLLCEYGPVWDSGATTVSSANAQNFSIEIPAQGGDTFSNMIMELSADDINVKITDVYVTTSEKTDAEQTVPAQCDGSLDMTVAYGNGAVSGELGEFFMNDTSKGEAFSGFANKTTDVYPFEFGSGGTLEFTASVPEGQTATAVDVNFQFQKQGSDTGKFCDIAPIWEASRTVSGPVDETFTVAIPSQGGNTFSNLIMELSEDDVNVKITGVKVTPSAKTADAPTVPAECEASPLPSVYPVDGINSAAMFNGTFGDEEGGLATIQSFDSYEFPTGSASYGGWSNGNQTLYPIEYTGGGFFAQKKIYFCASTTEAATVYFRFENEVYPANSQIIDTASEELTADGVMGAYALDVPVTYAVNSLVFYIVERDTAITMGKVMGNWNGLPTQNITTDTDNDGVVDYCDDFPNLTPEWVDTDGDGASDDADDFPEDASQWEAATP